MLVGNSIYAFGLYDREGLWRGRGRVKLGVKAVIKFARNSQTSPTKRTDRMFFFISNIANNARRDAAAKRAV